jgi:hypothetical protein
MVASIMETLAGVLRYFPNTMIVTFLTVGLLTARLNWFAVGAGGVLLSILVLIFQYIFLQALNLGPLPGAAILESCSILPITTTEGKFSAFPSVWMAVTTYFATYILTNAVNIYTAPANQASTRIPVVQRKGLGLISIIATVFLWLFLVVPRSFTGCETIWGSLLGIGIGATAGWAWWKFLYACMQPAWPDIHGVMIGTAPGALRIGPLACSPASASVSTPQPQRTTTKK